MVQALLTAGADTGRVTLEGRKALVWAAIGGHAAVRMLLGATSCAGGVQYAFRKQCISYQSSSSPAAMPMLTAEGPS